MICNRSNTRLKKELHFKRAFRKFLSQITNYLGHSNESKTMNTLPKFSHSTIKSFLFLTYLNETGISITCKSHCEPLSRSFMVSDTWQLCPTDFIITLNLFSFSGLV